MSTQKYVVLDNRLYQRADSQPDRVIAAIWEPSKGDSDITAEKLLDSFPELDESTAASIAAGASKVYESNFSEFLHGVDEAIDAHGVEPVALDSHGVERFGIDWEDRNIAYYVNTGDTYSATIIYDPEDDKVYLTTWGDWLQAWERGKEKEAESVDEMGDE